MKNFFTALLFVFMYCTSLYSFYENREKWWSERIERATLESAKYKSEITFGKGIGFLLEREIKRSTDIVEMIKKTAMEKSSDEKLYSGNEISLIMNEFFSEIFYIKYTDYVLRNINDKNALAELKLFVKEYLGKKFNNNDEKAKELNIKRILREDIRPDEWKLLNIELRIIGMMRNNELLFNNAKKTAAVKPDYTREIADDNKIISAAIERWRNESYDFSLIPKCSEEMLENSILWQKISGRINRKEFHGNSFAEYETFLLKIISYVDFLAEKVQAKERTLPFFDKKQFDDLLSVGKKIDSINRQLYELSSINSRHLAELTASEIRVIRDKKNELLKKTVRFRSDIFNFHSSGLKGLSVKKEKERDKKNAENRMIAGLELDTIIKSAEDFAEVFKKYHYSEEAFESYATMYNIFMRQAKSNRVSAELQKAMESYSIIQGLKNFDIKSMEQELILKKYLKSEGKALLERYAALSEQYRRQGIQAGDKKTAEKIILINRIFDKWCGIKIGSWKMDQFNYADIDAKAVHSLRQAVSRSGWEKNEKLEKNSDELKIKEVGIYMEIPEGWKEDPLSESDRTRGIIKLYRNFDKSASISLKIVQLNRKSVKEISDEIARISGGLPIKGRWGKKDESDYFWSVFKDSESNLVESYVVSYGNKAFVITGKSSRDKYKYFREKFGQMFESFRL